MFIDPVTFYARRRFRDSNAAVTLIKGELRVWRVPIELVPPARVPLLEITDKVMRKALITIFLKELSAEFIESHKSIYLVDKFTDPVTGNTYM